MWMWRGEVKSRPSTRSKSIQKKRRGEAHVLVVRPVFFRPFLASKASLKVDDTSESVRECKPTLNKCRDD